ncbi:MAG: hypothetical protein KKD28_08915 [Chloroflexi bacterium]|nr:hypothetical protein [Chloroflexota bacterium]MBU1661579.1 hypothetical protein [Chloroflexota bacterium]
MEAHGQSVDVWLEFGETDVFTPTTTASGITLQTGDGQTIPYLDELAEKGYLAIRVPHAPPTYTLSSLLPGIPPGEPDAMTFSYYSPPSTTTLTTVAVSVTRRVDLEQIVNVQYPIANNQSHWEVWWLPQGEQFPFPDQPFRLDADSWPPSLGLRFRIDFGSEASALDCAGCPVEVLGYNGYLFAGPYSYALRYGNLTIPDPQASFGVHCAYEDTPLNPTAVQYITPTVPFTHTYCLENWDTVTHTFTITTSSSQGWDYTYYYQSTESDSVPVPVPNVPFTITVGPPPNQWTPGLLGIIAVHAPNIAVTDTMRETLHITATSVISPSVWAYSGSFCLAPSYQLNEGGGGFRLYLPLVVR